MAHTFDIDPFTHKGAQKIEKIHKKGKGTTNPHEKDTFLKRSGPQLPLAKRKTKTRRKTA